jgi:hypothetical protein
MDYRMIEEEEVKADTAKDRALGLDEGALAAELELERVTELIKRGLGDDLPDDYLADAKKNAETARHRAGAALGRAKVEEEDLVKRQRTYLSNLIRTTEMEHARRASFVTELRKEATDTALPEAERDQAREQADTHVRSMEMVEVTHEIATAHLDHLPEFNQDGELVHLNRAQRRKKKV